MIDIFLSLLILLLYLWTEYILEVILHVIGDWPYLLHIGDPDVDTGASCSVFPHHSSAAPIGPSLLMADGRPTKA